MLDYVDVVFFRVCVGGEGVSKYDMCRNQSVNYISSHNLYNLVF